jgi:hypothetical protein
MKSQTVTPPVATKLLTPLPVLKTVIEIPDSLPAMSGNSSFDTIGERKSKLRRQIGNNLFSSNTRTEDQEQERALHKRLLLETPSKTVETLIGDSMAMGHDTPTTLKFLKTVL